jgi:hypothetical protein
MIYAIVITVVLVLVIYALYLIGKKVKEKEAMILEMMSEQNAKKNLNKYKRKSTPKVPTIKK